MIPTLNQIGFGVREFGKFAFLFEALPATIEVGELDECIRELVKEDEEPSKELRKIASIAYRLTNRKKLPSNNEFAKELIKRLLQCQNPWHTPFGADIFAMCTREEIQRLFKTTRVL
jgi:DNA mismatch repair protein MutL